MFDQWETPSQTGGVSRDNKPDCRWLLLTLWCILLLLLLLLLWWWWWWWWWLLLLLLLLLFVLLLFGVRVWWLWWWLLALVDDAAVLGEAFGLFGLLLLFRSVTLLLLLLLFAAFVSLWLLVVLFGFVFGVVSLRSESLSSLLQPEPESPWHDDEDEASSSRLELWLRRLWLELLFELLPVDDGWLLLLLEWDFCDCFDFSCWRHFARRFLNHTFDKVETILH